MRIFKLILTSALIISCGTDKKDKAKDTENLDSHKPFLTKQLTELDFHNKEKNLLIKMSSYDKEFITSQFNIAKSIFSAWGESIYYTIDESNKTRTPRDLLDTLKAEDERLDKVTKDVIHRFKERCPSFFGKFHMFNDLNIKWNEAGGDFAGTYTRGLARFPRGFSQENNVSYFSFSDEFGKLDRFNDTIEVRKKNKTYEEKFGFKPWELDYSREDLFMHFSKNFDPINSPYDNLDFTIAHELGHHIVSTQFYEDQKIEIASSYLHESLAEYISGICYGSHYENKKLVTKEITKLEDAGFMTLWPLATRVEGEKLVDDKDKLNDEGDIRILYSNQVRPFVGLVIAQIFNDDFNPDFLMNALVESLHEMKGRKLNCSHKENRECGGMAYYYNLKLAKTDKQKPFAFTLAEFMRLYKTKVNIPEKMMPLWDAQQELQDKLED